MLCEVQGRNAASARLRNRSLRKDSSWNMDRHFSVHYINPILLCSGSSWHRNEGCVCVFRSMCVFPVRVLREAVSCVPCDV